jgi:prevent-host-death family protein
MKKTNALKLRQNLGSVLAALKKDGSPILVEQRSKPAAVLITLEDFQKRFVDRDADQKRKAIIKKILSSHLQTPEGKTTLDLIKESRR